MSQVVDFTKIVTENNERVRKRSLDAQASYTAMEQCLKVLEMNSMSELRSVKAMLRRTMKDMVEIGKNGKKTK